MKFNYRGQLKDGKMIDIIDFENDLAICDKDIKIKIDEFQTIFVPTEIFKNKFMRTKKAKKQDKDIK